MIKAYGYTYMYTYTLKNMPKTFKATLKNYITNNPFLSDCYTREQTLDTSKNKIKQKIF